MYCMRLLYVLLYVMEQKKIPFGGAARRNDRLSRNSRIYEFSVMNSMMRSIYLTTYCTTSTVEVEYPRVWKCVILYIVVKYRDLM